MRSLGRRCFGFDLGVVFPAQGPYFVEVAVLNDALFHEGRGEERHQKQVRAAHAQALADTVASNTRSPRLEQSREGRRIPLWSW